MLQQLSMFGSSQKIVAIGLNILARNMLSHFLNVSLVESFKNLMIIFSLVNSGQKKLTKRLCERIDGIHTSSINEYTTHLGLFLKQGFYTTAFVNVSESLFLKILKSHQSIHRGMMITAINRMMYLHKER